MKKIKCFQLNTKTKKNSKKLKKQIGVTLIELMVGISIGLLTVMVALAALMTSRSITGTVSEASTLQQQAAYAFRVIGQQIRQAGSVELNLAFNKNPGDTIDILDKVAFIPNENRSNVAIKGNESPGASEFSLELSYQNYSENLVKGSGYLFQDCLGKIATASDSLIEGKFVFDATKGELHCKSQSNTKKQAIIENVTDLQFSYLVQDKISTPGYPTIQNLKASEIAENKWDTVFGIEVCLELSGKENIDTTGTQYTNCKGETKSRSNKLRMVFRNTFQIRSQGSPSVPA